MNPLTTLKWNIDINLAPRNINIDMNESKRLVYGKHSSLKLYTLCKSIEVNFYL